MNSSDAEKFIYREARLLDRHQYAEWLDLWTKDGLYWVPWAEDDIDPERDVSVIYDRWPQLDARVARLLTGKAYAQVPVSRLCRMLSNIEVEPLPEGGFAVEAVFLLGEMRLKREVFWYGRQLIHVRPEDGQIKMSYKKVMLLNNNSPIPNLGFLI